MRIRIVGSNVCPPSSNPKYRVIQTLVYNLTYKTSQMSTRQTEVKAVNRGPRVSELTKLGIMPGGVEYRQRSTEILFLVRFEEDQDCSGLSRIIARNGGMESAFILLVTQGDNAELWGVVVRVVEATWNGEAGGFISGTLLNGSGFDF